MACRANSPPVPRSGIGGDSLTFVEKVKQGWFRSGACRHTKFSRTPGLIRSGLRPMSPHRKHNHRRLLATRKKLRSAMTPAEARLWTYLKAGQLNGRKFRRQHSVGSYILDFYCPGEKLAVELDGEAHVGPIAAAYDAERTAYLQAQGIEVLRFENKAVWDMPEALLNRIREGFRS